jgi:diguanylate cyclase (GGDEF)-like protein
LILVPLYTVHELARFTTEEQRKAHQDDLTGLPNRKALFAEMRARSGRTPSAPPAAPSARGRGARSPRMALLLLDIDQFRRVNDALGHTSGTGCWRGGAAPAGGDRGRRLRGPARGDEFAVLAPRLVDPEAAGVLAQRVADALAEPVTLDGLPLDVTAAIGVAVHPDHGTDNITLLRHAEVAMYDAKDRAARTPSTRPNRTRTRSSGWNCWPTCGARSTAATMTAAVLPAQIEMATGEVVGTEALLRWNHPQRGYVSPDMVIKVAEHTAVMRRLTNRVMDEAIGQLAKWKARA